VDQYQVIVQISPKYRGSFNTLALERSNRTAVPSRKVGLTWSIIKTPALTSEIRFRFGLSIDGDEKKNQNGFEKSLRSERLAFQAGLQLG